MSSEGRADETGPGSRAGPFAFVAICWMVGVVMGWAAPWAGVWLLSAATAAGVMAWMIVRGRRRGVRTWGLVATAAVAAAWTIVWGQRVGGEPLGRYVHDESQLAQVTGVVDGPPRLGHAQRGAFARFSYQAPVTHFTLRVETIRVGGEDRPVTGRLLVKIRQADHRVRVGERIEATGWLAQIEAPYNPGELDYRAITAQRGIVGRLTLPTRGNWRVVSAAPMASAWSRLRQRVSDEADASLRLGLEQDTGRLAFLEKILLGRRTRDAGDLQESFRRVGLAHLLSISGAHLGILLGLVWLVAKLVTPWPRAAALVVLVVLALFLLAVPGRVPIIRAGVMAALFCTGYATGRRTGGTEMVSLAALLVLIWRPLDLFAAGFQLSFGVVAALLLFARPVSHWLWADPVVQPVGDRTVQVVARTLADCVAVSVVAFAVAMPLVAHHFQLISPLAVLLSLAALPVVAVLMGLGYLKVLIGLAWPSVGAVLAGPLRWVSDTMTGLVEEASTWPGAAIELVRPPSVVWTVAALGVIVALLAGWFARRVVWGAAALGLCAVWLAWPHGDDRFAAEPAPADSPVAWRLNMFAVGDGSCYLLRLYDPAASGGGAASASRPMTVMFDCGSQAFLDVGRRSIAPALGRLGVKRIDLLMLSHADLDHFGGVLDMMDHVRVDRVLVPPQLLAEARQTPRGAAAFLVQGVQARGAPIEAVHQGWRESVPGAELQMLWPPPDYTADRANDWSLVLSVRPVGVNNKPGPRLLLNGDIQQDAITALLDAEPDLRAAVCDLPHHGSFVDASPRWLKAVSPRLVLQSSGPARLRHDRWADTLRAQRVTRLITDRHGMVDVIARRDGTLEWQTFRETEGEAVVGTNQ